MTLDVRCVLPLAISCVVTATGARSPTVRDSAGVRIVENPPRATAPVRFVLDTVPRLDVGGLEDVPANEFLL